MNSKILLSIQIVFLFPLFVFSQTEVGADALKIWKPVPRVVTPGVAGGPPSDAIVLFDGTSLDAWEKDWGEGPVTWEVEEGVMTVVPGKGGVKTKQSFGDVQLHLEWRAPEEVTADGQDRGNSGVFLMERYEVQILDSYQNATYPNGQAAAVYKQHIPLVNAMRPPGGWNTYDIFFRAPVFNSDSLLIRPAYLTVLHNGVLVQDHVELRGTTYDTRVPFYSYHPSEAPIRIQDHSCPVSFRNIWVRKL